MFCRNWKCPLKIILANKFIFFCFKKKKSHHRMIPIRQITLVLSITPLMTRNCCVFLKWNSIHQWSAIQDNTHPFPCSTGAEMGSGKGKGGLNAYRNPPPRRSRTAFKTRPGFEAFVSIFSPLFRKDIYGLHLVMNTWGWVRPNVQLWMRA